MVRVLRPGGLLLITRRTGREARAFLARYQSREEVRAQLQALGLEHVVIQAWQIDYDQVFAYKPASALVTA